MNTNEKKVLTVAEVNEYIKIIIDNDKILNNIYIKGEISNYTNHYKTGHHYFTLKDNGGLIKSVMFKSSAQKLKFTLESGMKIVAHGRISVFPRDGTYVFYADNIEPDGIGSLYIAYEQMKKRLEDEGLFRTDTKKAIPKIPLKIGIITSPTGAAVRDIINIINRRFPFAEIILYPTLVQGDEAAGQMIGGVNYFNSRDDISVIIIGRGGGSIEDLWAFNDETLARVIYKSKIPIVSAVGHETDFTICDFVADKRAPTPSAAAELVAPDTEELKQKFLNLEVRMESLIRKKTELYDQAVKRIEQHRMLTSPYNIIDEKRLEILRITQQLEDKMKIIYQTKKSDLQTNTAKLEALNPLSIISRGYSAVYDSGKQLIKSIDQVKIGDEIFIKTTDGNIISEVKGSVKNE